MSSIKYENGKTLKTRTDSIELKDLQNIALKMFHQAFFYPEQEEHVTRRFLIFAGSVRNNHVICCDLKEKTRISSQAQQ
jgi:hypothetical protein